ncbi:MAG: hypothetical protein V4850_12015 [Myxococcota bacterium]
MLHKPPGWTPLEAMEDLRARTPALAGEPMVYAGRLDPMAEGLLLVLTGEDRFGLPAHLTHDKRYEATLLFGVRSDTHDALGRLASGLGGAPPPDCAEAVAGLGGTHTLPLPVWSAYRVRGRPLHAWAREGRLHEISVPVRDMVVTAVERVAATTVRPSALLDDVHARITRVRGTFRQAEALADWAGLGELDLPLVQVTATLTVTSGTYIRALAHDVGARLGCGALLLALRRTRVGPYEAAD